MGVLYVVSQTKCAKTILHTIFSKKKRREDVVRMIRSTYTDISQQSISLLWTYISIIVAELI